MLAHKFHSRPSLISCNSTHGIRSDSNRGFDNSTTSLSVESRSHPGPSWKRALPVSGMLDASAALLLLQVGKIATDEVQKDSLVYQPSLFGNVPPHTESSVFSSDEDSDRAEFVPGEARISARHRCRTVSVDVLEYQGRTQTQHSQRPRLLAGPVIHTVPPSPTGPKPIKSLSTTTTASTLSLDGITTKNPSTSASEPLVVPHKPSANLVGITTAHGRSVKGVLRRKFSWKNFPELETYLIDNRQQYLQYSSQLNYTSEQKRYNNRLTQGLLDLAAEEGYVFEDFTFAAIRDRIRCYYKSCVQAAKKKKRKRRK
mmetsp:Transcript_58873/g.157371  ORF Transcript_58873/g.157371 Transcript_58873/m.157371 type:complete len:314 (+) Transcript_58873:162-1103(+)